MESSNPSTVEASKALIHIKHKFYLSEINKCVNIEKMRGKRYLRTLWLPSVGQSSLLKPRVCEVQNCPLLEPWNLIFAKSRTVVAFGTSYSRNAGLSSLLEPSGCQAQNCHGFWASYLRGANNSSG